MYDISMEKNMPSFESSESGVKTKMLLMFVILYDTDWPPAGTSKSNAIRYHPKPLP